MANPQKQLTQLLSKSQLLTKAIADIHQRSHKSIPDRHKTILDELEHLRSEITSAGVGRDRAKEDRYMELLEHRSTLERSAAMGRMTYSDRTPPPELKKAIAWGQTLLDLYSGDRPLVKGVGADLERAALRLEQLGETAIASRLRQLHHEQI